MGAPQIRSGRTTGWGGSLVGLLIVGLCCALTACGYTWRGQQGSLSEQSLLGDGNKTLKIKSVEQTTLYAWLPYQIRSQLRDDITQRGLARWVDSGPADYTLTVKIPSFQLRSYGQYKDRNLLFTATINAEFLLYNGSSNTLAWQSGVMSYSENYESANEEEAVREVVEMVIRRGVDRLQQRF